MNPCWTHLFERAKNYAMLAPILHLNLYELWNCSSASPISFLARCALLFLKKCSHASLRFIWELVIFLKKSSLASLKLIWEKEILCSRSSLIFVWACQKQHMKISSKVIDIQQGYNKNFHEDHWTKWTWFLVIVLRYDDVICESCWWVIML